MTNPIGWCDKTWNPMSGCSYASEGCRNCWAEKMHKRLEHIKGSGYMDGAPHFSVRLHPERLNEPLLWKKPQRIFVCSMGDLFHEDVPDIFIERILSVIHKTQKYIIDYDDGAKPVDDRRHNYMILTKRPLRMMSFFAEFSKKYTDEFSIHFPYENLWLGVSVEDQKTANERIPLLLQIPAAKRFVSYESALGPVDFTPHLSHAVPPDHDGGTGYMTVGLDWVIMGGETGPGARPMHPDWARSARDQCKEARVPFFFKSFGEWVLSLDVPSGYADTYSSKTRGSRNPSKVVENEIMVRIGKKAAGCVLDGVKHKEVVE